MTACTGGRSSLIIAGFDVLDPLSQVYLIDGFDRGAAQPTVSEIESTILDGAAVTGLAAGNRSPVIPLAVRTTDRLTNAALVNQILMEVNQPTWQMTWTPAGGYPVVFDCYRATVAVTSTYTQEERATLQTLQISCEALPFGRSPTAVTTALSGSPVLVDAFDATPTPRVTRYQGTTGTLAYVTTPAPKQGSKSLDVPVTWTNYGTTKSPVNRLSFALAKGPVSVAAGSSDLGALLLYMRQPVNTAHVVWFVTVVMTTSDGTVHTGTGNVTLGGAATWAELSATFDVPIVAGSTISAWTITVQAHYAAANPLLPRHLYFDDFAATPAAVSQISDGQGAMLSVSVAGSARAPISLALSKVGGGTFRDWCVHAPPGDTPSVQPLIPLGGVTHTASYTTAAGVRYDGTYSVWVSFGGVGGVNTARTITVTISESSGSATASVSTSITPPTGNNMYYIGDVSLPITDYPPEASITTTIAVTSGITTDVLNDVLLLDTRGKTVVIGPSAPGKTNAWVDAPDPSVALGGMYSGTASDRSDAASVAQFAQAASALVLDPGTSTLLVFSPEGALQGTASYFPRWLQEATQ